MDKTQKTASRSEGMISCDLGRDLKREWVQWCEAKGLVPGKALRGLVEKALVEGLELKAIKLGDGVRVVLTERKEKGATVGKKIVFSASENKAIQAVAAAQGYGFQAWVVAAVRAALAKAPSYGQQELVALVASNSEMAKIAVELSALRKQGLGAESAELEKLEMLVREHVEKVSAVMALGVERWELKISS